MKKLLLSALVVFLLAACSSIDKKYSEDSFKEDVKELKKELSGEDFEILTKEIMRSLMKSEDIEGKTYSELLKEGKAWEERQKEIEAEQKALADKALREEQERIDRLTKAVMVSCFEKGFENYNYQDYITYKFAIQNKSDKDFRAIKGTLIFTDLFDDKIKSMTFKYDQPIKAGESVTWDAQTSYNQFIDEDKSMKNKDLKDLKVIWKPEKIIFEDGTTLE